MKFTKMYNFISKWVFSVLTFTNFWIFHKFHHFRHVVFLYSGRNKGVVTLPPFRQGAFWSPKRVLGLQIRLFWLFSHFWAQKCTFGVILRPGPKGLWNKWFEEPFWALWEPKTENELILALLAPKVQNDPFLAFRGPKVKKWPHFRILAPKVRKRSPETLCLISLFSQGAKWTPKSGFGVQKRIF